MLRKCGVCDGKGVLWTNAYDIAMECWQCQGKKVIEDGYTNAL